MEGVRASHVLYKIRQKGTDELCQTVILCNILHLKFSCLGHPYLSAIHMPEIFLATPLVRWNAFGIYLLHSRKMNPKFRICGNGNER
jgi:hypothetical protein